MATINCFAESDGYSLASVNLCTSVSATGPSTNVADFGGRTTSNGMLKIVTTIGGSPSSSINLEGSVDGVTFYNIQYSLVATPDTWVVAAITPSTAATFWYVLRRVGGIPWRYFRINITADNNVTVTADVTAF